MAAPDAPLTIDLHTHILPESWPDLEERYGYGGFPQIRHTGPGCARLMRNGQVFREIDSRCWDPVRRAQDCDRNGVDIQVLSTVPVMFGYWAKAEDTRDLAGLLNDGIASLVADHTGRFLGLGTLPLQAPDLAIKELERCVKDLGLAGVQIGTHVNDWNLDAPELFPVFEAAQDLGAAIFVHPWDIMAGERMTRYMLQWLVGMPAESSLAICSLIFGGVLERLPGLRFAFAHGGGAFAGTLGRIERGFVARPDLCAHVNDVNPRTYLKRLWVDSLVHDAAALRHLISLFGASRVALGSDYPFPLGEETPGALVRSLDGLTEEERRSLLGGAAREFLGLRSDPLPNA